MNNTDYVVEKKILASDRDRFINCIVDFLFVFVTFFLFGFVVVIVGNIFNWNIFSIWDRTVRDYVYSILFIFLMLNYLILEWLFGRSFGKLITGTIVVDKKGLKPGFVVIFKRTLCRLIPFDALSFLGNSGRIWHDSISNTYVVDKKALRDNMKLFEEFKLIGVQETDHK